MLTQFNKSKFGASNPVSEEAMLQKLKLEYAIKKHTCEQLELEQDAARARFKEVMEKSPEAAAVRLADEKSNRANQELAEVEHKMKDVELSRNNMNNNRSLI